MKHKYTFTYILTFLISTFIIMGCTQSESACVDTNCSDYSSQEEAQRAFEADPECRDDLDHDNDYKACEQFDYQETTNCPTTVNCGCSGKTKAVCKKDPCCRWEKGQGCKCK